MMNSNPLSAESLQYIHGGAYTHEDSVRLSQSLLQDAARLLCQNLLFTSEHFLHSFNLAGIEDNHLDNSEGYSFLSDFRNDFTRPEWACNIEANIWSRNDMSTEVRATLARVFHEATLGPRSDGSVHHLVRQYEASAHRFLEYLILLILLTGGEPDGDQRISEGFVSELVSLRFENHEEIFRPIYVFSTGHVQIDNFSTTRWRVLPKHVGTMLVVYLVHVRPFLAQISPRNPVASSSFLFPTAQGHWHTQSYLNLIRRESQQRIGKSLDLEDINDVHIRYLKETSPVSLTPSMWNRLNAEHGGCSLPPAAPDQLPSSDIIQQWKSLQTGTLSPSLYNSVGTMGISSRTPSPAISDTSLGSPGVLLPCQYSFPIAPTIPELKTSFSAWSSSSNSPLSSSPVWTPISSAELGWDAMMDPNDSFLIPTTQAYGSFPVPTPHQQFEYNTSSSNVPSSAPVTASNSPKHVPQGGISLMGFIPWEAEKENEKPASRSASKRKTNGKNKDKVINSKAMKKSPKGTKTGKRTSRSASLKSEDDDSLVSCTNGSVTRILENLGLTNAVLNRDRSCRKRRVTMSRVKEVEDPVKQTDRMLENLGLTNFVTK
ncbi:hypothetical protein FKW77_003854 [Venturia effusa]|uniref:Uncharacterized protein n=1 Tax=Venturia effusa TaxID=50376 RepID=A0A517L747_9PEZI|nr:hypothetical protein FKW77_003854 [Venturia effusa]